MRICPVMVSVISGLTVTCVALGVYGADLTHSISMTQGARYVQAQEQLITNAQNGGFKVTKSKLTVPIDHVNGDGYNVRVGDKVHVMIKALGTPTSHKGNVYTYKMRDRTMTLITANGTIVKILRTTIVNNYNRNT